MEILTGFVGGIITMVFFCLMAMLFERPEEE
jgi:hypothetical protein